MTSEDELPFAKGNQAAPGPAFITKAVEGYPWGGDARTLARLLHMEDLAKMVVLDTWIRNCDRYRPAPNLRINRDNVFLAKETGAVPGITLKAIDHTHAFTCGGELTRRLSHLDFVQDNTVYGCFPEFMHYVNRARIDMVVERLLKLDVKQAEGVVARVPLEWQVSDDVRKAWSSFIADRAAFVAANVAAWLWP